MVKEKLLKFDGTPLFPERIAYTVPYQLSAGEASLPVFSFSPSLSLRTPDFARLCGEAFWVCLVEEYEPLKALGLGDAGKELQNTQQEEGTKCR